jgi:tripartite-type tricarboxylate transporter receptor subunit TctC
MQRHLGGGIAMKSQAQSTQPRCRASLSAAAIVAACLLLTAVGSVAIPARALAADARFPLRPLRIIDPFPPGGATDYMDRILAQKLGEAFGQPVVVDNRPGAAGNVAAEIAARANPDGYTLYMGLLSAMAPSSILYSRIGYDAMKDFVYISSVAAGNYVLVANPKVPAKSVQELVALAKSRPELLKYGSVGIGSPAHLGFELLNLRAGTKILHVPYKGAGPLVGALTGGEVDLGFVSPAGASALVRSGRLTALAVSGAKRSPVLPAVPTLAETGFSGFDVTPWYGYLAPAGVPRSVVRQLNSAVGAALDLPDVQKAFAAQGLQATRSTPERFRQIMEEEIRIWSKVIKEAGIKAE